MGVLSKFKNWLAGSDDVDQPMEALHNNPVDPDFDHLSDYLNLWCIRYQNRVIYSDVR